MRSGDWLGLGATVAFGPVQRRMARSSLSANQTTSFLPVSGFGSGAWSDLIRIAELH